MEEVKIWDNKPRWMWCWDNDQKLKVKEYVVHIFSKEEMEDIGEDDHLIVCTHSINYEHCAEIEPETRLTNYELSQLLKCFGVERCSMTGDEKLACNELCYDKDASVELIKIRYKQGKWEEPTRETVMKWWNDELPDSDIVNFVSFIRWYKE